MKSYTVDIKRMASPNCASKQLGTLLTITGHEIPSEFLSILPERGVENEERWYRWEVYEGWDLKMQNIIDNVSATI